MIPYAFEEGMNTILTSAPSWWGVMKEGNVEAAEAFLEWVAGDAGQKILVEGAGLSCLWPDGAKMLLLIHLPLFWHPIWQKVVPLIGIGCSFLVELVPVMEVFAIASTDMRQEKKIQLDLRRISIKH